ncbi:MAG TPA: hypothetical protein VJY62_16830 [Bacteroidia bacterium]|nr:hypothetical protein [Bacteroidia bacterium]
MEKKRRNIDNFFRENLSDFELSKKEGNWELLNHLLNEQERKKKKRRWFFLIFCFLIMLTSGLLVLLPGKKSTENTNGSTGQINTPVPAENNSFNNKTDKSITTNAPGKNEIDKDTKNDSAQRKSENTSLVNEKKNTSHTIAVKKEMTRSAIAGNSITEHSPIIKAEINLTLHQPNISLNDSAKTEIEQISYSEPLVQSESQAGDSANANSSAQQTNNTGLIPSDSILTKSAGSDSLTATSKNNSPADSSITKPVPPKESFLNFNFYAGLNIYSTSSAFTNKENVSVIGGLEVMHPLSSKFSISLTGLYSLQGGYHLDDTAIATQKTYFLDVNENISEQTIQIRQLYKLYFPLSIYYSVTKRHALSGAIQWSYLVNTNGNYTERNLTSGITNESQKNNVKGYMDGIKSTNFAVTLGYQFRLSETFDISTRITRELTEGYVKGYFYGVNTNPSWTFQTFLIVKF